MSQSTKKQSEQCSDFEKVLAKKADVIMSVACKEGRHGHCSYWVCGARCKCKCHK